MVTWWDEQRAAAWRAGDVVALQELYLPDSRAGDLDARNLEAYAAAGVAVDGWQTIRSEVREVRRSRDSITVEVVRRQTRTRASSAAKPTSTRVLPEPSVRRLRLTLRWAWPVGGWAVGRISPVVPLRRPGQP